MHAITLIANAIRDRPECPDITGLDITTGQCAITGNVGPAVLRKHLIGKSFTNLDILAAPDSQHVGVSAYVALKYKWERMSSWICDGKDFIRLTRQDVRRYVISGEYPAGRWAGYVTTSYKKHGALWAPVNIPSRAVWRFETHTVDCSGSEKVAMIWLMLNEALRSGIPRPVIETLEASPFIIQKVGIPVWMKFKAWAQPLFRSPLYQFLCYLLPSKKELENEHG